MRFVPALLASAALMLSACGSSATAPAESPVSSAVAGGVASEVSDCAEGAPARNPLGFGSVGNDGVVGTVYNDTSQNVYLHNGTEWPGSQDKNAIPCRLAAGKSTSFSGSTSSTDDVELYISAEENGQSRAGTKIGMNDVLISWPRVVVKGFSFRHPGWEREWNCTTDASKNVNISEGQTEAYDDPALGTLTVTRLPDDGAAAREYVGTDSSKVDDWARIDVRISRVGACA